jgi:serine/threonine protein kinase
MPSPTTIDEFLELVCKSGVVEEKKLTTYLERARAAQSLPPEPPKLAGVLVRDGLLTQFQAEQFLQGKWRRFTIGKYKVLEKLGAGGMGSVYLCEHKLMRRRVAVKVLPTAKAEDTSSLERFYREARAVAALDHPNIVRAYDIDQDDKLHFLVMEHVDGSSLQEIIKKVGPIDVLRACHYIRQAALGLQHAHETAGIVHRDIKPGNILVDRNGIVKVLDMGLARFFHDEEDLLTKKFEENVLGTADYLAPEQALDSHAVDIRADIYSLGATFYFCLTGRTPFAEGTVAQKLIWHQTRQPKPIRQLRPQTPEGVSAIVERMMAKDAGQRFQTPGAVAEALAPWTQTPIPPPPDNEMPQLSPAAMGGPTSSDGNAAGPKTPPTSGDSAPRKVWQVSQTTPTPPTTPPQSKPRPAAPAPAPAPQRDLRKTNPPPPGPLNLELPAPVRAPAPAPQVRSAPAVASAAPVPAVPAPAVPAPAVPAPRPIAVNGNKPAAAPVRPVPVHAPAEPEEEPSWGDLLTTNGPKNEVTARAARKGTISLTRRAGGVLSAASSQRLGWVLVLASLLVLGMILVVGLLVWVFGRSSSPAKQEDPGPVVLYVNPKRIGNSLPSISDALSRIRGKGRPARIIVQDDLAESDVLIDVPNVTVEAEEGKKTIHWRPSTTRKDTVKLFSVYKAEGVCVKGFTLDGDKRIEFLVNLFHYCPGARFEDLKLIGFTKHGIWVTNAAGGKEPDQHIQFKRLEIVTTKKDQAAFYFSIASSMRDAPATNEFFLLRDCKFEGPGEKVQTKDQNTLDHIDLPNGIQPVQVAEKKD